jgi:hypothetical protein
MSVIEWLPLSVLDLTILSIAGAVVGARAILFIVRRVNRRDDPRCATYRPTLPNLRESRRTG